MSESLNERLNKILPRVISDAFLSGSGIGNEVAFYIFDYPPEDELKVRDYLRTLVEHIPKQKHGLRVKHLNLFDLVLEYLKGRNLLDKAIQVQRERGPGNGRWNRPKAPRADCPRLAGRNADPGDHALPAQPWSQYRTSRPNLQDLWGTGH
jgi:hypothetical protein